MEAGINPLTIELELFISVGFTMPTALALIFHQCLTHVWQDSQSERWSSFKKSKLLCLAYPFDYFLKYHFVPSPLPHIACSHAQCTYCLKNGSCLPPFLVLSVFSRCLLWFYKEGLASCLSDMCLCEEGKIVCLLHGQ